MRRATPLLRLGLLCLLTIQLACLPGSRRSTLPPALSDDEFWTLTTELSEPPGAFSHSENLVSNEAHFAHTIRRLRPRGGVYFGVGPEQNFSYIARLRPSMAFIVDIRRENRSLHLMYKALFELSHDRGDFVSRLFSRARPDGLQPYLSVQDLFAAYERVTPSPVVYDQNVRAVRERLVHAHGFSLSPEDIAWIERAMQAFYTDGPEIHYGRSLPPDAAGPSYRALMTATDFGGDTPSYLASEDGFAFVKELQVRNAIVPLVGDFAGARTLRRAGEYVRGHRATVSAFYASNVEVYLTRAKLRAFCDNLASLPYLPGTVFLDSKTLQTFRAKLRVCGVSRR